MHEKELRKFSIMLIIIILVEMTIIMILLNARANLEKDLCEKWGGKLYEDDHCYLIKEMDKCLDSEGFIRDSARGLTFPSLPPSPPYSPNKSSEG